MGFSRKANMTCLYFKTSSGCLVENGLQGRTMEAGKRPAGMMLFRQRQWFRTVEVEDMGRSKHILHRFWMQNLSTNSVRKLNVWSEEKGVIRNEFAWVGGSVNL